MSVRRYTRDELLALSRSKLVVRPDNLPAIEQWIDEQPQASNHERHKSNDGTLGKGRQSRAALAGAAAAEGSPMGAFSTGRPTLTSRGSMLRNANGDDVALGPPRNMFPSSRNMSRPAELQEKNGTDTSTDLNRKNGTEKEGIENKDRWSSLRDRRPQGDLEDEKKGFGRHDKDNEGDRRNGYGHKEDPRWSREERSNGNRAGGGGWREREAARRDREYHEKEPEWMDDPLVKKDQELGGNAQNVRTQDDFEEWKRQMSGKPKVDDTTSSEPVPLPTAGQVKPSLKLDGIEGGFFGGFKNGTGATTPGASTPSASTAPTAIKPTGKGKTSRFASMFKPTEPESTPAPPAAEESQPQATNGASSKTAEDQEGFNRVLAMLGGTKINSGPLASEPARELVPSYAEPVPTSPPPPPKSMTSSGTLPGGRKSRFTDMFAQEKNPERLQSPQQGSPPFKADSSLEASSGGPQEDNNHYLNQRLPARQPSHQSLSRPHAPESAMSPDPSGIPFNALREQQPRPSSGRPNDPYNRFEPPSRGAASPDRNIQDLLAQPRQRPQTTSSQSQDLLNLLKNPASRPQSQQALPANGGIDQADLERWLQHQQPTQSHAPTQTLAPKPRGPQQPPGGFEEQLMRNYGQEQQRQEQLSQLQERQQTRAPPGFYNHEQQDAMFAQQQRHVQQQHAQQQAQQQAQQHAQQQAQRQAQQQAQQQAEREAQQAQLRRQQQYAEMNQRQQMQQQQQPPRRMPGHPAAQQMHIPQQHSQPDFHQLTSPVGGGAPPPGFNQMPRYPPGFANVNTFPQQRDQPPPGFTGGPMSPPAQGGPPGFYGGPPSLPPGFHAMRSPTEVPARGTYDEYIRR